MNKLIIDTASNLQYIALIANEESFILTQKVERDHSEVITNNIRKILLDAGIKLNQIDVVYVNVGPGSFTGLRVGVVTAKAIALYANTQLAIYQTSQISNQKYYLFHNARQTYLFDNNNISIVDNPLNSQVTNPKQYFMLDNQKLSIVDHDLDLIISSSVNVDEAKVKILEPNYFTNLNYKK
jgi:tRNA threonylcarbamoyl adenosine modification protein YeaZ